MKFLALPVKNLGRHRTRSILTSLGIAIALAGMIALVGLSRGLERSWVLSLQEKGTHIVALQKGSIDVLSAALDEGLGGRIAKTPGIDSVMAGLGELVELETGQMAYLAGRPLDGDFWQTLHMIEGTVPTASRPDGVVLGEALAGLLGKKPGETIQLSGREFKIVGIAKQMSVLDDRSVMIPMPAAQQLLGREGKVSGFHIRVRHPETAGEMARIQSSLTKEFPGLSFTETSEFGRNTQVTRLLRAMAWSSSTVALGMAFVAVLNTLLMSVMERTREIGLLSAIGWHSSRVVAMVILDGLLLSAAGSALGIALGMACLRWIIAHPQLGGLLQPEVTGGVIFEGAGITLLLGVLGGLYPAWRATRLNPMDLLRSE